MAERQSYPLSNHVRDFADFAQGMQVLAEMAPERLTAGQLIFFMRAATDDIAGKDPTFSSIKAATGDKINKSLHSTYRIFLAPSRAYDNGLGWLEQQRSPDDDRVKFLRLTSKGRSVMGKVLEAIQR